MPRWTPRPAADWPIGDIAWPAPMPWGHSVAAYFAAIGFIGRRGPPASTSLRWDGTSAYPPTCFHDLPGGNLAYSEGCLVVATADHLHVLVGEPDVAVRPGDRIGQGPAERQDLLLWRAELLRRARRPAAEVRSVFDAAIAPEFAPERRFLALVRRGEYELAEGNSDAARAAAKKIADSDELSRVVIRDADGVIRSARAWANEEIGERGASAPWYHANENESHQGADAPRSPGKLRLPLEPTWRISLDRGHEWALLPDGGPGTRPRLRCRPAMARLSGNQRRQRTLADRFNVQSQLADGR